LKLGDVKCYWYSKKKGRIVSYCECWDGTRDGKPGDCCSHHSANILYQVTPGALADPEVSQFEIPDEPASWHAPHERAQRLADDIDWGDDEEPWGTDPSRERRPYERRWTLAEVTCECPTPWDVPPGKKPSKSAGFHCVSCHLNWANVQLAAMHRRNWTDPCRSPFTLLDVDTGASLVYQDADGVWRMSWNG